MAKENTDAIGAKAEKKIGNYVIGKCMIYLDKTLGKGTFGKVKLGIH